MAATLSPRIDTPIRFRRNSNPLLMDTRLAKADGLTLDEAQELAGWLRDAGNLSIEVVREAEQYAVVWNR